MSPREKARFLRGRSWIMAGTAAYNGDRLWRDPEHPSGPVFTTKEAYRIAYKRACQEFRPQ